jgi:hypothetical protein
LLPVEVLLSRSTIVHTAFSITRMLSLAYPGSEVSTERSAQRRAESA